MMSGGIVCFRKKGETSSVPVSTLIDAKAARVLAPHEVQENNMTFLHLLRGAVSSQLK
jgi:hypothetical protein